MKKIFHSLTFRIILLVIAVCIIVFAYLVWKTPANGPESPGEYSAPEPTNVPPLETQAKEGGEEVVPEPTNIPPLEEQIRSEGEEPLAPEPTGVPPLEEL